MKVLVLMLFTAMMVSGCQLTRVEGEIDDVEIKVNTAGKHTSGGETSKGKFCPPGQAKKGNC